LSNTWFLLLAVEAGCFGQRACAAYCLTSSPPSAKPRIMTVFLESFNACGVFYLAILK
jgi:hypothetical protein